MLTTPAVITHDLPFLRQPTAPWWGRFNQFHRGPLSPRLEIRGRSSTTYQAYLHLADKLIGMLERRGADWYTLTSLDTRASRTVRAPDIDGVLMRVVLGGVPLGIALAELPD